MVALMVVGRVVDFVMGRKASRTESSGQSTRRSPPHSGGFTMVPMQYFIQMALRDLAEWKRKSRVASCPARIRMLFAPAGCSGMKSVTSKTRPSATTQQLAAVACRDTSSQVNFWAGMVHFCPIFTQSEKK